MIEAEWLNGDNPSLLVEKVRHAANERKFRLFACSCCRIIWHLIDDEESRKAVEVVEQFVDGRVSQSALATAYSNASHVTSAANKAACGAAESWFDASLAGETAVCAADAVVMHLEDIDALQIAYQAESSKQAQLLRDIFGNPFRPVPINPDWLTSTVVALARSMYDSRDFSAMPILADALQDAGCENEDILNHCRSGGPHVRGCWVVDLILGKE